MERAFGREKEQRWKIIYDATDNDWLKQYGKEKWKFMEAAKQIKMLIKRVKIEGKPISAKTLTPRDIPNIEPPFIDAFF